MYTECITSFKFWFSKRRPIMVGISWFVGSSNMLIHISICAGSLSYIKKRAKKTIVKNKINKNNLLVVNKMYELLIYNTCKYEEHFWWKVKIVYLLP